MHRVENWQRLNKVHKGHYIHRILFGETDVSTDLKLLLVIGGLYALSVALSNTFVNVYLWKQKSDYITIALYNLFIVIAQPIVFILAGRWAKQVDRVIVLRLGVFFLSFFFSVVLLLGEQASQWAILLGVLLGIGFGFYWLAFNVLTFEITEPKTRDIFNGFLGLLNSFAGMIGPFFAGWLITSMAETTGYTMIFTISLALFVLAVVLSFFLKRRAAQGRFLLCSVLRWREISADWRRILLANMAQGLREGSFAFLITIWIFVATGTEMALGTFGLVTSGVSLIFYYVAGRLVSPKHRHKVILLSAVVLSLAVWIIAFELTFARLMTYGVIISAAFPLLMVPFLSMTYDVIGRAKKAAEWRIEYIVGRELFLNGGRILSILVFIAAVLLFHPKEALPYYIIVVGNAQLLLYYFIRNVSD
ncbi:MFS transporter [Caldalkalibacillus thermarum]|uniref:MFS transporter n=1 Tax=Caldalkalibacillus thermarum TaxID=296745 RepID=UPI001663776F|nr:MFS transporter [Caldalkalibacillus thermarum]GGK20705.1 MFS transporter [Caldalkalibacillus thermarum]